MAAITLDKIPFPEGRFKHTKKEFFSLLLEAIEEFRVTTNTPEGKKLMINSKTLARYIAFGTLRSNSSHEVDTRKLGSINSRIGRWFPQFDVERSGKSWIITPKIISVLRKEAGLKKVKETKPKPKEKQDKKFRVTIDYTPFVEEKTITTIAYSCTLCREVFYDKDELLKHFADHRVGEFK